jgi:NADH-quinone oxidoreductase subunit N
LAITLAVFLFSLAGLPPLAGFIGKFYLFAALIQNGGWWYMILAIVGILNSVVALFYYTIFTREMFLRSSENNNPIPVGRLSFGLLVVMLVPTLILGVYWEPLSSLVSRSIAPLF